MNVVNNWLLLSSGHWWLPFMASIFVKIFALSAAMSATASAGVGDWYLSRLTYLFKRDRSTHIRMPSVSFFGVTTIGAHHSVGSVTGSMMPCVWSTVSIALCLSWYANATDRGRRAWHRPWYVEFSTIHCFDLSVEDLGELFHYVFRSGQWAHKGWYF